MKLAYATLYDPGEVTNWSGLGHYILSALEMQEIEIERIGPLQSLRIPWAKAQQMLCQRALGEQHIRGRELQQLKSYARQIASRLKESHPDVVLSPGTLPVAQLDCEQPIVIWADATFASLVDFYPEFQRLCRHTLRDGHAMEQAALDRCRMAIYSSDWAAESARKVYKVDPAKVRVVPFGANLDWKHSRRDVEALIQCRIGRCCRLLLVGVDWARKGADLAVAVGERLRDSGVQTELTIIGCTPPRACPGWVRIVPFVNKATPGGASLLQRAFEMANFLLLPSQAECYGIVLAEACSFGVPCVVTNVGGIPTAIRDGINGAIFARQDFVDCATAYIRELFQNPAAYRHVATAAFTEYQTRLNWNVAGAAVAKMLRQCCKESAVAG